MNFYASFTSLLQAYRLISKRGSENMGSKCNKVRTNTLYIILLYICDRYDMICVIFYLRFLVISFFLLLFFFIRPLFHLSLTNTGQEAAQTAKQQNGLYLPQAIQYQAIQSIIGYWHQSVLNFPHKKNGVTAAVHWVLASQKTHLLPRISRLQFIA